MKYEITIGGVLRVVDVEPAGEGRFRVRWDGEDHDVDLLRPTPEAFQMLIDGESWEAGCVARPDGFLVDVLGVAMDVEVVDPRRRALRLGAGAAGGLVTTQMPGRVVRHLAKAGDAVRKGQPVIVVEAMKMENELKAPVDGTVAEVLVAEGQAVEAGTKLVRIE
ncbi:MAG: biotin/lipoyl-containing protein [Myxococcota bacterium]